MKRWLVWGAGVVVALAALAAVFTYPNLRRLSNVGAGYVALQMCACVEVVGRAFDDCRLDMLPDMDRVEAEPVVDGVRRGVHAWVAGLAERTAWHAAPNGCTLD
ncbi:MAG: hypothetical protein ACQGVC_14955 [Myxococcota bacterium]